MYLGDTEVKRIKAISLFGMADKLARDDSSLRELILDEVKDSAYGNQEFCNDTVHIYPVSNIKKNRDSVQELIYNYCSGLDVIDDDGEFGMIYFAVCW